MPGSKVELGFDVFDADNHYYEATDAFTRHLEPGMAKRCMQWAEVNGKQRLMVGGKINRFIPNPMFDPVARPGCLDEYFRGRSPADDIRGAFGELEPIHPAYRDPAARVEVLDRQGIEACFLFPTLGVGMEEALLHDPEAAHAAFRAFNRWLDDDWGFDYEGRIFGAPVHHAARPRRGEGRGRVGARAGRPGDRDAGRAGHAPERRPLAGRPGLRPVLEVGRRRRHHRRLPLRRVGLRPLLRRLGRVGRVRVVPPNAALRRPHLATGRSPTRSPR